MLRSNGALQTSHEWQGGSWISSLAVQGGGVGPRDARLSEVSVATGCRGGALTAVVNGGCVACKLRAAGAGPPLPSGTADVLFFAELCPGAQEADRRAALTRVGAELVRCHFRFMPGRVLRSGHAVHLSQRSAL